MKSVLSSVVPCRLACLAAVVLLPGCGEGASGPPSCGSVTVEPASATLITGESTQFSATARDGGGKALAGQTLSWTSSNSAVAAVSATGVVTGMAPGGPVNIGASCAGKSGTAQVTVMPIPVASVTVTPGEKTLRVGGTAQLSAAVKDNQGKTVADRPVSWTSSAPGVASVSAAGLVTGVSGGGPVTITATSEGKSGIALITVEGPVATVALAPDSLLVGTGKEAQFVVTLSDAQGRVLAFRNVSWSSSNAAIAAVNSAGVVTGITAGGPVTITATSEGVSGSARVTVFPVLSLALPSGGALLDAELYRAAGAGPHPTLLLMPGYGDPMSNVADFAAAAHAAGWNALTFTPRGMRGSTGWFSYDNVKEDFSNAISALRSPAAALDWGVAADRIAVGGHSLGGWAAFYGAARDSAVRCLVALDPGNAGAGARYAAVNSDYYAQVLGILTAPTLGNPPLVRPAPGVTPADWMRQHNDHPDDYDSNLLAPLLASRPLFYAGATSSQTNPALRMSDVQLAFSQAGAVDATFLLVDGDHDLGSTRPLVVRTVVDWLRAHCTTGR